MTKDCPYCITCPTYECFRLELSRNVFVTQYCRGNFNKCERKRTRERGEPVPDNLLPNGFFLPRKKEKAGHTEK